MSVEGGIMIVVITKLVDEFCHDLSLSGSTEIHCYLTVTEDMDGSRY